MMRKWNLQYVFIIIILTVCLGCYAKPVATFGWHQNSWINNVFSPAGIETESLSAWEAPDAWSKYSMVVITQDSSIPVLNASDNDAAYNYLKNGGVVILTGAAPNYLGSGPKGILDISSIEKWFGAEYYAYGRKTPFIAVDIEHPLVSHLEVRKEYDWSGIEPGLRIANLTSGKLLVGSEQGAAIFYNKVGKGQCIYLVGNPLDIDNPKYEEYYATVVSSVIKLLKKDTTEDPIIQTGISENKIKGDPNLPIDSPTNLIAEADLPRLIKLKWEAPGGGASAKRAYMYRVIRSVVPHFPANFTQEFLVKPALTPSPANETFEWADADVDQGIVYYYKVVAYDEKFHESKPSSVAEVFLPSIP